MEVADSQAEEGESLRVAMSERCMVAEVADGGIGWRKIKRVSRKGNLTEEVRILIARKGKWEVENEMGNFRKPN